MKIMIVAPKSITAHILNQESFRFDYTFWNFFMPLCSLGHNVSFFDTQMFGTTQFLYEFKKNKPDLIFCVMTGDPRTTQDEPWEAIENITRSGICTTFNWYCDDTWRYENFSSKTCNYFHFYSTTELDIVQRYLNDGFKNIKYANWHSNPDVYSSVICQKNKLISFVGRLNKDRERYLTHLRNNSLNVYASIDNSSFEDMIHTYSSSVAGLNFTVNASNGKRQMKARIFEIPATRTILLTERVENIENIFEVGKEILVFDDEKDLIEKVKWIDNNHNEALKIASAGYDRFLRDHTSQVRLKNLLAEIK